MSKLILLLLIIPSLLNAQSYKRLHEKAIVVDTHNDFILQTIEKGYLMDQNLKGKTYSDLQRFKEGGVDVQVFSIWCDGNKKNPYAFANQEIDSLYAVAARNPGKMMIAKNSAEIKSAVRHHKLAAMLGVEGGHMMENSLDNLTALYNRGVRYMTLTWNNSTPWSTSALEETRGTLSHKGLTDFGKQVVRKMNELGMLVDLSHVGEQTFWDAINTSTKPILVSHSCVYNLCPAFRNLKDDQIKAVKKNGGVIHLNFYSGFVDSTFERRNRQFNTRHKAERDSLLKINPENYFAEEFLFQKYPDEVKALRPPLSMLIDHLDYLVKMIGADHVGLGSDFDGISSSPQQLDDVTTYPLITKALVERGYSKSDIRKILGGNFLRLLAANEKK
ncbi:MAG: rane dipeptidase [Chitinophagaceae bacterium]|nr:rane dipeptidase [Chitinophagaceae bacterium]